MLSRGINNVRESLVKEDEVQLSFDFFWMTFPEWFSEFVCLKVV